MSHTSSEPGCDQTSGVLTTRGDELLLRLIAAGGEASYESSAAEAFGNLPSSPAYLSPAFLKAEPSSMNFRC